LLHRELVSLHLRAYTARFPHNKPAERGSYEEPGSDIAIDTGNRIGR